MSADVKGALEAIRLASLIGAPIVEELGRRLMAGHDGDALTTVNLRDIIGGEVLSEVVELIVREQARRALASNR